MKLFLILCQFLLEVRGLELTLWLLLLPRLLIAKEHFHFSVQTIFGVLRREPLVASISTNQVGNG